MASKPTELQSKIDSKVQQDSKGLETDNQAAKQRAERLNRKIQRYRCSITSQVMIDPVLATDGRTYEREAIAEWLESHDTSPLTNEKLPSKQLIPNVDKKSDISEFLDEFPELYDGDEIYLCKSWIRQFAEAIEAGNVKEVQEWLIKDRRLLTVNLRDDFSAFYLACQSGNDELAETLLDKLISKKLLTKIKQPDDFDLSDLNRLLIEVLRKGDLEKSNLLVTLDAGIPQSEAGSEENFLHEMVMDGNLKAVSWLLEKGHNLNCVDHDGDTPLILAIREGNTEIAEFLLSKKADIAVVNKADENAVQIAVLEQRKAILPLLVGDKSTLPPLHLALELADNTLLKRLLDNLANDVKTTKEFSESSSSSTSSSSSSSSNSVAESAHWVSLEAVNKQGKTAFYVAVEKGNVAAAKLLLEKAANPTVVFDEEQATVLQVAVERNDSAMLKFLLQTSAVALINKPNIAGNTPLHLAAKLGQDSLVPILLEAGASHKLKNLQGESPVKLAKQQNKIQTAHLIQQIAEAQIQAKLNNAEKLQQRVTELEAVLAREVKEREAALAREAKERNELRVLYSTLGMALLSFSTHGKTVDEMEYLPEVFSNLEARLQTLLNPGKAQDSKSIQENASALLFSQSAQDRKESLVAAKPKVDAGQLKTFLDHIAWGRQDEAEALLKANKDLALAAGDVTDHAKRTFRNITGFQLAVWNLDWHMWTMILRYLPPEARKEQAQGFKTGAWVKEHAEHATWKNLTDALQVYIDNYKPWTAEQRKKHWVEQVGGAQFKLPIHVLQEYNNPDRPFDPTPKFDVDYTLARSLPNWLSSPLDSGFPSDFGIVRAEGGRAVWHFYGTCRRGGLSLVGGLFEGGAWSDRRTLISLLDTRLQQRVQLVQQCLTSNAVQSVKPVGK
jgi:ankyrin repeat protein